MISYRRHSILPVGPSPRRIPSRFDAAAHAP
jgi:hypothetical protein